MRTLWQVGGQESRWGHLLWLLSKAGQVGPLLVSDDLAIPE